MALKLGIVVSTFSNFKLERVLRKGSKNVPAALNLIRNGWRESRRTYHHQLCSFSGSKYLTGQTRCLHVPSALWGKVVPFKLSDIGEGIVEVTVKEWYVKPGDKIAQFDNICEVQSDKASVTITSRYDGVVKKLHCEVEQMAKVGAPLIDIEVEESESSDSDSDEEEAESKSGKESSSASSASSDSAEADNCPVTKALATPAVRRIARENNINIHNVPGTGKAGRVLKEDILAFLDGKSPLPAAGAQKVPTWTQAEVPPPPPHPTPLPQSTRRVVSGKDQTVELTGFQKAMVKSMSSAWSIPHFSYCDEVAITELMKMKDEMKRLSTTYGVKLTFMPFFIKAASLALEKYPQLNAHFTDSSESLVLKASHNIGVAMDTQNGLIVPNVKNVQELSVLEVARELNRLQTLGARGQLGLDDLKDGTFTLSNIGSIGGTYTKPIIFAPQVIIGALGKIQVLPRFDENKNVVEAHLFNISWSADHRVVDGATVARFSNLWKAYLTAPKLLLEL